MIDRALSLLSRSATLRTFGTVVLLAALAKMAGLIKELAVAAEFGVSPKIDAYLFVFNLMTTPVSIWYGAIFAAFAPYLVQQEQADVRSAQKFRGQFFTISIASGILTGLVFAGASAALIDRGSMGLSPATAGYALEVLPLLGLIIPILFVASFSASCLMAKNHHANTLYEGFPALVIFASVIVYPGSLIALATGTLVGVLLQMIATLRSAARVGVLDPPRLPQAKLWKPLWPALAVMLGIQTLQSSIPLVDQFFAVGLDPGSLAVFSYALRIAALATTLAALALPRVLLPALASIAHDRELSRRFVAKWSMLLLFGGMGTAAVVSMWSEPIVRIVFERGSFSASDTIAVAQVLEIIIWQLPFYLLTVLYSQHQFANRRYFFVAAVSCAILVLKITSAAALVKAFGLNGLAVAGVLVLAVQSLVMFFGQRARPASRA